MVTLLLSKGIREKLSERNFTLLCRRHGPILEYVSSLNRAIKKARFTMMVNTAHETYN
jgi:hypothetical protein